MKSIKYVILFLSISIYSQKNIIKLELKDSILKKTIADYIILKKNDSSEFKRIGYILLDIVYLNDVAMNGSLKLKYYIQEQYYRPTNNLPSFYTYIEDKLVFIYDNSIFSRNTLNTKKKQRKINRLVRPYLNKTTHLRIRNDSGKLIVNDRHLRDEMVVTGGGLTLFVYEDGKVVVKPGYNE